jgi:predicted RNase H-like nuclease (RuvC/YqgF family)
MSDDKHSYKQLVFDGKTLQKSVESQRKYILELEAKLAASRKSYTTLRACKNAFTEHLGAELTRLRSERENERFQLHEELRWKSAEVQALRNTLSGYWAIIQNLKDELHTRGVDDVNEMMPGVPPNNPFLQVLN